MRRVELRGIRNFACRGTNLEVAPGELLVLLGPNGAGKTTILDVIAGLVAYEGTVLFDGTAVDAVPARSRQVGYVFQDLALFPHLDVKANVGYGLENLGPARSEHAARVEQLLDLLGIAHLGERYPATLSGGEKQRVALARALVTEPQLIIADEPLSSLDVTVGARIMRLMIELRDRLGIAFLFVTHDLSIVRRMADRVAVMYLGRLLESSPADQLFEAPAHPYTRSLLAAVPVADPSHPRPVVLEGEPPSALTPPAGCVFHMRCKDKIERCLSEEPQEQSLDGDGRHRVRCHLCNS